MLQEEITIRFKHSISTTPYQATISIPNEKPPRDGFPVLYVLDGNAYSTMFKEIVKLQYRRPEKTQVYPMVIVSIGYDTKELPIPLRVYDFTPPASEISLPPRPDGTFWPPHGGANEFLFFIEHIVQPFVNAQAPININEQMIFGHSLGGLFVLYTLFTRPDLFRNYICFSPSIWWNECQILTYETENCLSNKRNLFIAVEQAEKMNMHNNAYELYLRLKKHHPENIAFCSPKGENHMSIVPAVLSEALRFCTRK